MLLLDNQWFPAAEDIMIKLLLSLRPNIALVLIAAIILAEPAFHEFTSLWQNPDNDV
jgi:hypothetical protein